ncbi:MAG: hypothetical protein A3C36_00960 [Omnitrophica WOR_2 bacterium RIFCSPHIGHO2_02_FULL_52_10]|nr:MAG: hypothetical protein A3C36_00960 [Omnitrophica WOR_2 bacterium RIFCSPHIGHO2_02_FULL_52_10]
MNAKKIFLDGKLIDARKELLESLAPGIVKGKGVFETMRVKAWRIFVLENHMERLFRGLRTLNIKAPYSSKQLEQRLYGIIKVNGYKDARLRLAVWKNETRVHAAIVCQKYGNVRGRCRHPRRSHGGNARLRHPAVCRSRSPDPQHFSGVSGRGISAVISGVRRPGTRYSHIKSLDYLCFRHAYAEALKNGFDEAILLNSRGKIVEGSRTNIFFVKDGILYTPAVSCGCLNGITRRMVMRLARRLGIPCKAVAADARGLLEADEAFVTNALLGVMPLTRVNGRAIGRGAAGPITEKLRKAYLTKLQLSCPANAKSV